MFRIQGFGFGVKGLGIQGLGFSVQGLWLLFRSRGVRVRALHERIQFSEDRQPAAQDPKPT